MYATPIQYSWILERDIGFYGLDLQEVVSNQMWVLGTSAGVTLSPVPLGFVSTDSIIPAWKTLGKRESNLGNEQNKQRTNNHNQNMLYVTENVTASP